MPFFKRGQKQASNSGNQVQTWKPQTATQRGERTIIPLVEVAQVTEVEVGIVWIDGRYVNIAVARELSLEYLVLGVII